MPGPRATETAREPPAARRARRVAAAGAAAAAAAPQGAPQGGGPPGGPLAPPSGPPSGPPGTGPAGLGRPAPPAARKRASAPARPSPALAHASQTGLAIVYRPLREITPYARNARTHSRAQLDKVKVSMRTFGWTTPMLLAGDDLLAGHARLQAAQELAAEGIEIPRHPDPDFAPTIDLSHLDPEQRRAYILADNRIAEEAGWDMDVLRLEFMDLQTVPGEFDLTMSGFDAAEIGTIMNGWNPDFEKIGRTDAELAAMLATIRIRCAQEQEDTVRQTIIAAVKDMEGVQVE